MDAEKQNVGGDSTGLEDRDVRRTTDDGQHDSQTRETPLISLTLSLCLAVFLVSIDRTIVTVAIPNITDEFHSYRDIGWYGSAYLICVCVLQPLFGRIYSSFDVKWTYLVAMVAFEIGSLLCALAPNSPALIIGRAIAGCGSGGILSGSFVVVAQAIPLRRRPAYTSLVGMIHSLGAVIAPLIGGAFTTDSTWRWCFWLNLPIGIPAIVAMCFLFHPQKANDNIRVPMRRRIGSLDLPGATILLVSAIMLFLALQYAAGGNPWNSPLVAGLLAGASVTIMIFGAWLLFRGADALVPPRIFRQRTILSSFVVAITLYGVLVIHVYYLPTYFQAIHGDSAIGSAVQLLPYIVACSVFSIFASIFVSRTGYFTPPSIVGCGIAVIGAGLLTTLDVDTRKANWIGFQLLTGIGIGFALYQGFMAVQAILSQSDTAIGTSLITFGQTLGGALAVSIGDATLLDSLRDSQSQLKSNVDVDEVIALGATGFRKAIPTDALVAVLGIYSSAISKVFIVGVVLAGIAFLSSVFMEFRSMRPKDEDDGGLPTELSNDVPN